MKYDRNPNIDRSDNSETPVQKGFVSSTPSFEDGEIPIVKIVPFGEPHSLPAEVIAPTSQDQLIPSEGDEIRFIRRRGSMPVVIGVIGRENSYTQNERVVSHPTDDAQIHFDEEGDIHLLTEETDLTLTDGSVQINGGNTPIVVDVDVDTDGEGNVTDVTPITDDSILV